MDQQAKKHLQEEFDASLEEKDQYISVLQTQVKKEVWNFWIKKNKRVLMGYLIGSRCLKNGLLKKFIWLHRVLVAACGIFIAAHRIFRCDVRASL